MSGTETISPESVDLISSFVSRLHRLDTSTTAKLRRAIRKSEWSPDVLSVVAPFLPPEEGWLRDATLKQFSTVAVLFGWNSRPRGRGSIGSALARCHDSRPAAERLMRQAINATRVDSVRQVLARIMSILDTAGVPVDWERLAHDLAEWESSSRRPQHRWAQDFWGAVAPGKRKKNG